MKSQASIPPRTADAPAALLAPIFASLICLSPLLIFWHQFQTLYWFHDDWNLTADMDRLGVSAWMMQPYGEDFFPLFKALWAAAIVLFHGSYFAMILILWFTHLIILILLLKLLEWSGFDWMTQTIAVLTLGMPWSNIETLGWAAPWSQLLCTLFFLLAWILILGWENDSSWLVLPAALCALASAWTFKRGVLTGLVLALFLLFSPSEGLRRNRMALYGAAALALPTAISLIAYRWMLSSYQNIQGITVQKVGAMASYAIHYFLLSPLFHILPIPRKQVGLRELIIAGACKLAIMTAGLMISERKQRTLLVTLLLFDLLTAGMLGVARFDRGLDTAVSYRYQYFSLLCFGPFLGIVAAKRLHHIGRFSARAAVFALLVTGWTLLLGYPWARHSERWAQSRGTEVRNAVALTPPDQRFGLPYITAGKARELIEKYHLH